MLPGFHEQAVIFHRYYTQCHVIEGINRLFDDKPNFGRVTYIGFGTAFLVHQSSS